MHKRTKADQLSIAIAVTEARGTIKPKRTSVRPWEIATVFAALLAGVWIGGRESLPIPNLNDLAALTKPVPDNIAATFSLCGNGPRITCVVDGDTFWLNGEKIRIADIDTPEISEPKCETEMRRGQAAKLRLLNLLNAAPFSMTSGFLDEDKYGRKLRTVYRKGQSLGEQLVSEGHARQWAGARQPWC